MSALASDICADFLVEVREILDQLGEQMVALERAPADRECLNAVFRGFHTIKGGAGFLDFTDMVAICHAVEDLARFDQEVGADVGGERGHAYRPSADSSALASSWVAGFGSRPATAGPVP